MQENVANALGIGVTILLALVEPLLCCFVGTCSTSTPQSHMMHWMYARKHATQMHNAVALAFSAASIDQRLSLLQGYHNKA